MPRPPRGRGRPRSPSQPPFRTTHGGGYDAFGTCGTGRWMLAFRGGESWAHRLLNLHKGLSSVSRGDFAGQSLREVSAVVRRPRGRVGQERGRGVAGLRRGVVFALLVACGAVVASV